MRGRPPLCQELVAPEALPHGIAGLAEGLKQGRVLSHGLVTAMPTELRVYGGSIWMLVGVSKGLSLAFRLLQDGVGLFKVDLRFSDARRVQIVATGGTGKTSPP